MPSRYTYQYRGTRLIYEYCKLSILDYTDEELDKSSNPFAQVIIAARMRWKEGMLSEEDLLKIKILAARKLRQKGFDMPTIKALFNFLRNYVLFEIPEMNCKFDDEFDREVKNQIMTWEDYDKMIIKMQAQEVLVKNLLKGTDFSDEKIAALADVDLEFVKEAKEDLKKIA